LLPTLGVFILPCWWLLGGALELEDLAKAWENQEGRLLNSFPTQTCVMPRLVWWWELPLTLI
jgi:hypothetical protein